MRRLQLLPVLIIALLVGCASKSQSQQWRIATLSYNATLDAMTDLANTGNLDLDEAEDFDAIRTEVAHLLDEWEAANTLNQPFWSMARLTALLDRMILLSRALENQP